MRLACALAVAYSHCLSLAGTYGTDPWLAWSAGSDRQTLFGSLAVWALFAVSGFLVSDSLTRSGWTRYFWHRDLRIFPGAWAGLAVTAFVFGPIAYGIERGSLDGYLSDTGEGPWSFLASNAWLHLHQRGIHGLLSSQPHPEDFNGSYWTLGSEYLCYLLIAVLGLARRFRPALVGAAFLAVWLSSSFDPVQGRLLYRIGMVNAREPLFTSFLAGAAAYHARGWIPVSSVVAAVSLASLVFSPKLGCFDLFGPPALTYLVLWAAAVLPFRLDRWGDYSYGTYLYHFPVLQLMSLAGWGRLPFPVFFFAGLALTAPLAFFSWQCVERPALGLKSVWTRQGK